MGDSSRDGLLPRSDEVHVSAIYLHPRPFQECYSQRTTTASPLRGVPFGHRLGMTLMYIGGLRLSQINTASHLVLSFPFYLSLSGPIRLRQQLALPVILFFSLPLRAC